jgi:hypothetical protein
LRANLRGNHLRRWVWSSGGAWGRPPLKPGNRFHGAQNGRKPRPGHCGSGAERAQRLGSAALGIIGKAAEHSLQSLPDHNPPFVHRESSWTRNPCTDSEWPLRCVSSGWRSTLESRRRCSALPATLHATPRMFSRFCAATSGAKPGCHAMAVAGVEGGQVAGVCSASWVAGEVGIYIPTMFPLGW